MIDRYYLIAIWLLGCALWPGLDAMLVVTGLALLGLGGLALVVLLPLMLREGLAYSFGRPQRAPFILLRWHQGRQGGMARRDRAAAARLPRGH